MMWGMTPLREARKARNLTVQAVAEAVGTDPSNMSRLELGQHTPAPDIARRLYRFYEGALSPIEIYDPTFMDEVGLIENLGNAWYRVVTRAKTHRAHGREKLRELLERIAPENAW